MIFWLLFLSSPLWARDLSVMSLNLHGYHPMDEERRILLTPQGKKELSWSHLHYFNEQEISRGLEKRQETLAQDILRHTPDLIFLQEVGGGVISQKKTCADFYTSNTAKDLNQRLTHYESWIGCRGNLGWWTDENTFDQFSVITENSERPVMKPGDNPYPFSLMMEGLAILTGPQIKVHESREEAIRINDEGELFYLQWIKFSFKTQKNKSWWIAVNIHGGHKIQNFEQATATRHLLTRYLSTQKEQENFQGLIVGGDFNALEPKKEVSTVPWSFFHAWQTQDELTKDLLMMNRSDYKPFATLDESRAHRRVQKAVSSLFHWFSLKRHKSDGSLHEVSSQSDCKTDWRELNPFCQFKEKIDHIFVSDTMRIKKHSGIYQQNNWTDLSGTTSDHPGLTTVLDLD